MDTPQSIARKPIPWWPGVVVAVVFLALSVVLLVLFLKKPQAQPPSTVTCNKKFCPHGDCEEGICTYQCNDTTCPSANGLACGDDRTCNPQSPPRTDYCNPGTFDDYSVEGKCAGDGTCASDCNGCQTASCSSTCTDPDKKGRISWNDQTVQCELKDDWSNIDCPTNCNATSSTKPIGDLCPRGWSGNQSVTDASKFNPRTTNGKCYTALNITGDKARELCQNMPVDSSNPTGTKWTFNWNSPSTLYECCKDGHDCT